MTIIHSWSGFIIGLVVFVWGLLLWFETAAYLSYALMAVGLWALYKGLTPEQGS